jgi:hypothetical protein
MIKLTQEQLQALAAHPGTPLVNPETNEVFVLVPQNVYEQMKRVVDGPNARGWDDPELDAYEHFRKKA